MSHAWTGLGRTGHIPVHYGRGGRSHACPLGRTGHIPVHYIGGAGHIPVHYIGGGGQIPVHWAGQVTYLSTI